MQAKPVPHFGVPLALPAASKRSTVPEPFSFSGRKPGSFLSFGFVVLSFNHRVAREHWWLKKY